MKLYFSPGACSLSVRILLNELGIIADYERVDFKTGKTASGRSFSDINPKKVVPVLLTDENEYLTENIAIHQFLADNYKNHQLLPSIGDFNRYRVLEFSSFIATDVHKGFGPLFNAKISSEDKNDLYIPIIKKRFSYLNTHLENKSYLVTENFTIADAYLFVIITWLSPFKIELSEWPSVEKYFLQLKERESIQKSLAEEKNN